MHLWRRSTAKPPTAALGAQSLATGPGASSAPRRCARARTKAVHVFQRATAGSPRKPVIAEAPPDWGQSLGRCGAESRQPSYSGPRFGTPTHRPQGSRYAESLGPLRSGLSTGTPTRGPQAPCSADSREPSHPGLSTGTPCRQPQGPRSAEPSHPCVRTGTLCRRPYGPPAACPTSVECAEPGRRGSQGLGAALGVLSRIATTRWHAGWSAGRRPVFWLGANFWLRTTTSRNRSRNMTWLLSATPIRHALASLPRVQGVVH